MLPSKLARYLDLANHHTNATPTDIAKLCKEVLLYKFHSAFVNPVYVPLAKSIIKRKAAVGTVVSFPLGQDFLEDKILLARHAAKSGADELDICMNIGMFKAGKLDYVRKELRQLVRASKAVNSDILIKFIIETSYLNPTEIKKISRLVLASGADFIKTNSGMGPRGVTVEDVKTIRSAVGNKIRVKAAGGITNYKQALELIRAGADRLGTSHAVDIIKGIPTRRGAGKGE